MNFAQAIDHNGRFLPNLTVEPSSSVSLAHMIRTGLVRVRFHEAKVPEKTFWPRAYNHALTRRDPHGL